MRLPALLLLVAACAPDAPDPELHQAISGAVGQVLHPSHVYVRFLEAENQLVVFERLEGAEFARLPATAGARTPLALDGHPCELASHGASEEVEWPRAPMTRWCGAPRPRSASDERRWRA